MYGGLLQAGSLLLIYLVATYFSYYFFQRCLWIPNLPQPWLRDATAPGLKSQGSGLARLLPHGEVRSPGGISLLADELPH